MEGLTAFQRLLVIVSLTAVLSAVLGACWNLFFLFIELGKGQFAFEYTAHYSLAEQDKVPYEIYIKKGEAA